MRLFVALDIDTAVRQSISRFLEGVREFAPEARWVRPESLHVTLKFIGERPTEELTSIQRSLSQVKGFSFRLGFRGYGFFPTPRSARVFWIGIEAGKELSELASLIDGATAEVGIAEDDHAYSPHLTLARGGKSGSPRRQQGDKANFAFRRLQEKLAAMPIPEFGTMSAHEFYLFESKLAAGGAVYTKVDRCALSARE
jgi:2'-5' RNA ligase